MPRKVVPPPSLDIARVQAGPLVAGVRGDQRLAGAREVALDQVVPDPDQPRRDWDDDESVARLAELAASLKEFGVLQPLLVREDGSLDDGRMRYTIIAGGRRRAAAEIAGLTTLPVVIRDEEAGRARVLQLVENIQRRALAPLDEARGFKELIDAEGISAEALGARLHVSGQHVRTRLLLLSDQIVADAVARDQITPTTAREVLRLPDESRTALRARIEAGDALGEADIRTAREQSVVTGAVNPRAKGGGRVSRARSVARAQAGKAAAPEPTNPGDYQPPVDPAPAASIDRDTFPAPIQASLSTARGLYNLFHEWWARVDDEMAGLSTDERQELRRLLRADMTQLLDRLDDGIGESIVGS